MISDESPGLKGHYISLRVDGYQMSISWWRPETIELNRQVTSSLAVYRNGKKHASSYMGMPPICSEKVLISNSYILSRNPGYTERETF